MLKAGIDDLKDPIDVREYMDGLLYASDLCYRAVDDLNGFIIEADSILKNAVNIDELDISEDDLDEVRAVIDDLINVTRIIRLIKGRITND